MNENLHKLVQSIENLEDTINNFQNSSIDKVELSNLQQENIDLRAELDSLRKEYALLQETSKEVMEELNHSISVIEEYFGKSNADNKNIKS